MSLSRALAALLATTIAATAGCAHDYASGLAPTGEPLAYDWSTFRQGKDPIDEQDFYRIAGDTDAVERIEHSRSRGIFYNRAGLVLAAIGIGGLLAATTTDGAFHKVGYGLMLGLPIGGTMTFYGRHKAEARPHIRGDRPRQAAARYNAHVAAPTLGVTP